MHPMLNIAIRAVRKGGNIIVQNYDTQKFIKDDINKNKILMKQIIYKTYKAISETIYKFYPNHIVINQDHNFLLNKNATNTIWIINELDGKNNFIKNFPHFCVSIAVVIKNYTEISVIYDPIRNDLFTAVKGQGSQLNGYRTRCSSVKNLNCTIISVNFPDYIHQKSVSWFKIYKILILSGIILRCTGSTVLDLAYVSSGKIDCLFNFNLDSRNVAAGKLQVQESGCVINNFKDEYTEKIHHAGTLTSSPKLIRLITEKIRECYER